ncbi:hypothetical protein BpOF4_21094 (plasmid) [Alkalihalophilus pseudofirmus OF4]|uniref:Uncharacterized protein n=1 Tax=Alkalihalophilus pseudofirmus (strain ATCC BAA-2126 / JCM 17055 / OF4) TaxID=398511 RepID=D3G1I8_ALKPO|nr:hypothetical protein [Alkalihalophilus pseudofirmus]ADC52214.1 hypothetical protein BpOF4_21094 [Alkalihalophilus pseudofirmus OF4]
MTIVMPKVTIGKLLDGTNIDWSYKSTLDCRFLLLSQQNAQKEALKKLLAQETTETTSLFTIQPEKIECDTKGELLDLLEFENAPAAAHEDEQVLRFIEQRIFIVNQFARVLAECTQVEKDVFFKEGSYRPHVEGPLNYFIRNIEEVENEKVKSRLNEEVENLKQVEWYKVNNFERLTYSYGSNGSSETLLHFIKAIWTFWATVQVLQEPRDLILLVEVEQEWYESLSDTDKSVVKDLLKILLDVTHDFTVTLVVVTESLHLSVELGIRYKLYGKGSYIEFIEESDRDDFLTETLLSDWTDNEESLKGLLYDEGDNQRYIGEFLE